MRALIAFGMLALSAAALNAADLQPWMTAKGKQVINEDFSGGAIPAAFKPGKGTWSITDGALKGVEKASDKHQATVSTDIKLTDAIYQFDFKLGAAKMIHFSLNDAKGHVCRVVISSEGFEVTKDGSKTDAGDKAVKLSSVKMQVKRDQWHTMMVETCGKEILARVDDQHYGHGEDSKIAGAKNSLRFPMSADGGFIDNIKVWQATANAAWESKKSTLSFPPAPAPAAAAAKARAAAKKAKKQ